MVEGEGKFALGEFEGQGLMRFCEGRRSSIKSHRQVESLLKLVRKLGLGVLSLIFAYGGVFFVLGK